MIKMSEQNDMSPDKNTNVGSMFNINPIDILMYLQIGRASCRERV